MPLSAKQRAAAVDAMIFDVDGVLTRGDIVYGPRGEWKAFNVQDGHGFVLARRVGLKLALLSARRSEAVRRRAQELKVHVLDEGVTAKGPGLVEVLEKLGVPAERACFVGDDLVDLPAMARVGFPVAVANAADEVKQRAAWVTRRAGGEGAAREAIEFVLKAKGLWAGIVRRHLEDRR
jgi:3-deoxy-D-manno-octulosonate 8-phosphate phosphatase (KDO 8-P phosphatase)